MIFETIFAQKCLHRECDYDYETLPNMFHVELSVQILLVNTLLSFSTEALIISLMNEIEKLLS